MIPQAYAIIAKKNQSTINEMSFSALSKFKSKNNKNPFKFSEQKIDLMWDGGVF